MERVYLFAIGYFIGCLQFAFMIGKIGYGLDVRDHGSGNSGTTNALRVMGKKAGLLTFLGDYLKAFITVFLMYQLQGELTLALYGGLGVIIGHNWPVILKFKGGKGIAATLGMLYAFDWRIALTVNVITALVIYLTRYVSVGSMLLVSLAFVMTVFLYSGQLEIIVILLVIMTLALFQHRDNIKRLLHGKENKLGQKK